MSFSRAPDESRVTNRTRSGRLNTPIIAAIAVLLTLVASVVMVLLTLETSRLVARAQFESSVSNLIRTVPDPDFPTVAYVGNSFVGGSAQDSGAEYRWPALVSTTTHTTPLVLADGSSGYTVPGALGFTYGNLAAQVPETARLVVLLGSDDDESSPYDETVHAATEAFAIAKAHAPDARVIAIATFWVDEDPRYGILTSRDAVREAAAASDVQFVDPLTDHWLSPDPSLYIGDDGLHPTNRGHQELATIITPIVEDALAESAR